MRDCHFTLGLVFFNMNSGVTQYDIDSTGTHSKIFKVIRKIILSYPEITERKNAKQTSYSDEYAVIVMMRVKGDTLVVAFGKGSKLQKKYPQLQGDGKIVRHLYFKKDDTVNETLLREMIEESFVLGMEAYEMKLLKCNIK